MYRDRVSERRHKFATDKLAEHVQDGEHELVKLTAHDVQAPGTVFTIYPYGLLVLRSRPTFNITPTHTQIHLDVYQFDGVHPDPSRITITTSIDCPVQLVREKGA